MFQSFLMKQSFVNVITLILVFGSRCWRTRPSCGGSLLWVVDLGARKVLDSLCSPVLISFEQIQSCSCGLEGDKHTITNCSLEMTQRHNSSDRKTAQQNSWNETWKQCYHAVRNVTQSFKNWKTLKAFEDRLSSGNIIFPTFRYVQGFQRGRSGAGQQGWLEVSVVMGGFSGCRGQSGCGADRGQAESVLWLHVCSPRIFPGAGLRAANTHCDSGAIWELRWRPGQ